MPTSLRPPTAYQPPMRGDAQGWESGPALRRQMSGGRQRPEGLDPVPPSAGKGTPAAVPQWPPAPTTDAVAAEPDAYTARSGDRPAGGAPLVPPTAPPATYDEDRPISDWWTDYDDPPVPLRHLALVLLVSLGMWAGIVVALHLAGMWWRS